MPTITSWIGAKQLRVLVRSHRCVVFQLFLNNQATSKLVQSLASNAVAVALLGSAGLPSWCPVLTLQYRFLFPFEARKEYFTFTSFGALRSMYSYLGSNPHVRCGGGRGCDCIGCRGCVAVLVQSTHNLLVGRSQDLLKQTVHHIVSRQLPNDSNARAAVSPSAPILSQCGVPKGRART